jgi:hypothetical protein
MPFLYFNFLDHVNGKNFKVEVLSISADYT